MASSVGVGVASSVGVGVSVSLMLLEAVDEELEELEELEAVDDPQAVRADAVRAVARMRVTIFFFIDILLFETYFVRDTISHVHTFNNSKNYGLIKVYIWFPT